MSSDMQTLINSCMLLVLHTCSLLCIIKIYLSANNPRMFYDGCAIVQCDFTADLFFLLFGSGKCWEVSDLTPGTPQSLYSSCEIANWVMAHPSLPNCPSARHWTLELTTNWVSALCAELHSLKCLVWKRENSSKKQLHKFKNSSKQKHYQYNVALLADFEYSGLLRKRRISTLTD